MLLVSWTEIPAAGGDALPTDKNNLRLNYGNSDYDLRHRFTFSPTYLIPGNEVPGADARRLVDQWRHNSAKRAGVDPSRSYVDGLARNGRGTITARSAAASTSTGITLGPGPPSAILVQTLFPATAAYGAALRIRRPAMRARPYRRLVRPRRRLPTLATPNSNHWPWLHSRMVLATSKMEAF